MGSTSSTQSEGATFHANRLVGDYDEILQFAQRGVDIARQILTRHERVDGSCSCGDIWPCPRAESVSRVRAESEETMAALVGPTVMIRLDQDEPKAKVARRRGWFKRRPRASRKT